MKRLHRTRVNDPHPPPSRARNADRMIALRSPIIPCLWFDGQAEQAAQWYVDRFEHSRIVRTTRWPAGMSEYPEGTALTVDFELGGRPFNALNGGPQFTFDEAVSLVVEVRGQHDYDRVWDALLEDGGSERPCGWLQDRWGVSWQVVPLEFLEVLQSGDEAGIVRAYHAMGSMRRLDIAALLAAFDGGEAEAQ